MSAAASATSDCVSDEDAATVVSGNVLVEKERSDRLQTQDMERVIITIIILEGCKNAWTGRYFIGNEVVVVVESTKQQQEGEEDFAVMLVLRS
eukprot:scaffold12708_cov124-Amphora_coffeaeformis.AAC.3